MGHVIRRLRALILYQHLDNLSTDEDTHLSASRGARSLGNPFRVFA